MKPLRLYPVKLTGLLKGAVTWDRLLIAGDLQCEISDLNFAL